VRDRDGEAQAQGWDGRRDGRPAERPQKELIERAYRVGETLGLQVWCQDEAGPYQAIPQPGASRAPRGAPAHRPHEYVRGGTAKLLTLFRPATGEVRARPVEQATNAVLHPWLKRELSAILDACPPPPPDRPEGRRWADWDRFAAEWGLDDRRPPLRALLIWDNLAGHKSPDLERWLLDRGILPLWTPIAGSWLNLAESLQRILVRRALAGQHPESTDDLKAWLAASVRGWNADPTPFEWGGKRAARRRRARERRHRLGGSGGYTNRPIARCRHKAAHLPEGNDHGN
jgi:DDE superfamily endonuclease